MMRFSKDWDACKKEVGGCQQASVPGVMRGPRLLTCSCLLPQMGGKSFESITEKKNGPFWTPSQNFWPCFCWNDILFYKQLWAPTPHSCSHLSYCFRVSSSSLVNSLQNVEMLDNCARARMHMCGSRDWGALWWEDFAGVCSSAIQRTRAPPPSPSMASKADAAKAPHSQCCQHAQQKLIFLVGRDGRMESGCGLSE